MCYNTIYVRKSYRLSLKPCLSKRMMFRYLREGARIPALDQDHHRWRRVLGFGLICHNHNYNILQLARLNKNVANTRPFNNWCLWLATLRWPILLKIQIRTFIVVVSKGKSLWYKLMSSWALKRVVVLQKEKNLTIMPLHCWRNDLYLFSVGAVQFSKLESGCHMKYKIAEQGLRQLKVDNILWVKMRAARFLLLFITLLSPLMCEARGGRGGGGRGGGRGGGSRGGLFRWGRSIWQKVLVEVKAGETVVSLLFVAKMSFSFYEKNEKFA